MDAKNKMLLQRYQQDIIQDLDVFYIIDQLYVRNALSTEDYDRILHLHHRVDRVRYLIEKLLQNGSNHAFEAFKDSLQKDYNWLWVRLANENEPMLNDSFEDSLSKGDVPRLPDHHVRRIAVENVVAEKLRQLTRHNFLVLHGMSGSGKTSIVTSILRYDPELITSKFNGAVFWLNLGNCKTDDDIIDQQNKLYRKASSIYSHNSYMNSSLSMSSIGSNADSHSLSGYEMTFLELRDRLKDRFSEQQSLKDALLVLDEVNEKRCVEAFDIGCKILITTRDTDVVANLQPQIVKIENNFTERETLELFASCLDVNVSQLPRQAKKLHEICKGSAFNIALIGAQLTDNKERLIDDRRHWDQYVKQFEKKDYFFLTKHNNSPMKTIEVCINALKPTIRPLFKMLAILPDNAKVSAKVLSKLWNKEISEVETIMKQLRSKSLVLEMYDRDRRNYIYEVHDLIMDYLRVIASEEELKKLNSDFLNNYGYKNLTDLTDVPVDIVDDDYIAFYIGYHILNTKNLNNRWKLFNRLFMDLKFLGNKVRLTGPADVILDLQRYENHIADDEFDKEIIYSLKAYISQCGIDLYRYPSTDIVQSVLQHENKGNLYTMALQIAQEKCARNELYFEFLHEQNLEEIKPSNIDVKEKVTSVCFLGDYALVGTVKGLIKFFHIATNKLKKELSLTGSLIKWIGACPTNPPIVAALAADGVIKVWYIEDLEQDETENIIEEEPEEPYNNNYPSTITILPKRGTFINCRWSNYQETLIAHTGKLIILYTASGEIVTVIDAFERDRDILCCVPCNKDRYAIVATTNGSHNVEVIDLTTNQRMLCFDETDVVLDILAVPGSNRIITLKSNEILEHELKFNSETYQNNCNMCVSKKVIGRDEVKKDLMFTSMAVNKSGTLLFVSTDDSRVICVDLKINARVLDLDNRRGNVVSMAVSETCDDFMPGSDVLLTGTGTIEDSAKVWYLDGSLQTNKNGKARLTTKFDVSFVHTQTPQTPSPSINNGTQSAATTPKRHQSFVNHKDIEKKPVKTTMSLDRHTLKPLVLKGICNGNGEEGSQPLLAIVDDRSNIQILRGRKVLTEIPAKIDEQITTVKISPCNQYILYGLKSGNVMKYTLRTKETKPIMDVYSPVQYLNFVTSNLLMVTGKNRCVMAYRLTSHGNWKPQMLQRGNSHLGSQEILNDIQGRRKISPADRLSTSDSDSSLSSRDRQFPNGDSRGNLCQSSELVECFWIPDIGLITVEHNATIKLWNQELNLALVLNGRQINTQVVCAAFQGNLMVICDDIRFQTFELKDGDHISLRALQEYRLNKRITCCDLTADGNILAMGLESGEVVLWNVIKKRQVRLLKHHKSKVQSCRFSPVPDRLYRSTTFHSPSPIAAHPPSYAEGDEEQPPLVLVTMASEIVWWNVTYLISLIKMRGSNAWRNAWNVVTPVASPLQPGPPAAAEGERPQGLFFFGDSLFNAQDCWKAAWRRKTHKEGSKRKEILACIKLSGMNAKKLYQDDKFSCFVTVDNPGHIHIMNVLRP